MIKKYFFLIFITFFVDNSAYSAGIESSSKAKSDGREDLSHMNVRNSYFKKGLDALKQAEKYNKKGKTDKAKNRFNDVIKFLLFANETNPNEPVILNYLGYSYEKIEDFIMAEIYYEQGLAIDPEHIDINHSLGGFYSRTNRVREAMERLNVLKSCNCEEYKQLKEIIEGIKKSKY